MNAAKCSGLTLLLILAACNPDERRPGLWLTGEQAAYPDSWAFTDAHKEIAIEVATPYFIPHSVTIWCASMDDVLYVGARAPETKNWPGWVDDNADVRLGIDGKIYEVSLVPLDPSKPEDATELARLAPHYVQKYELPAQASASAPASRYWRVTQRS